MRSQSLLGTRDESSGKTEMIRRVFAASILAIFAVTIIVGVMIYVPTLSIQTRWTHLTILSSILGSAGAFKAVKTGKLAQLTTYTILLIVIPWLVYGYFYVI